MVKGELFTGAVVGVRKPKALGFALSVEDDGGCIPTPADVVFGPSAGFVGEVEKEKGVAGLNTALSEAEGG